jgi:hypothetical protein
MKGNNVTTAEQIGVTRTNVTTVDRPAVKERDTTTATRTTTEKRGAMTASRKSALAAGVFYLLSFISIPTLFLYVPVHDPKYIVSAGPDTGVLIGCVLEIIVALAGIGSAVALFPVVKRQHEGVALGFAASRTLEGATIFAGVAALLSVVSLRQAGAGAGAVVIGQTLVALYDRMFLMGQSFMPAVNGLLLGFLLYRSRLVPRVLPSLGFIGAALLVAGDLAVLFGVIGQHAPSSALAALPIAVWEFSLGVYLIVKGFKPSPILSSDSRDTGVNRSDAPIVAAR